MPDLKEYSFFSFFLLFSSENLSLIIRLNFIIMMNWQEYWSGLSFPSPVDPVIQIDLQDPDIHSAVITHLEPDILECEVKWVLRSITTNKASGGDEIPIELFQILKDDAHTAALSAPDSVTGHCWPMHLPETSGHS